MKRFFVIAFIFCTVQLGYSQRANNLENIEPGRFDQGKMWTFENPPLEYFKEAYNFDATEAWLEDARKSAVRLLSGWCSASFISENGLILTNNHCSWDIVAAVIKDGENFAKNGFYAATLAEERRVPNLFVDQLVKVADITSQVQEMTDLAPAQALEKIQEAYQQKEDWQGLELETRIFYSGFKYSLYGYKRYNDVRLVLYPELAVGYFGGDPDDFTYPRYNLDFTLFRAYGEDGNPLKPANYFEFNPDGVGENATVFVIGYPGNSGRYLTMAQLIYERDTYRPILISFTDNRMEILLKQAEITENAHKKDSLINRFFQLSLWSRSNKGILNGYYDEVLMTKKQKKEDWLRANSTLKGGDPWDAIEKNTQKIRKYFPESFLLRPTIWSAKVNQLIFQLANYKSKLEVGDEEGLEESKKALHDILNEFDAPFEQSLFALKLEELLKYSKQDYIEGLLGDVTPQEKAAEMVGESLLLNDIEKFYSLEANKLDKEPLMAFADVFPVKFNEAVETISQINEENTRLQRQIAKLQFELDGLTSPPDATSSLRLADGKVKGYEYNGTKAPIFTTYFGLYDRYYSHGQQEPWDLPARWKDPPMELLQSPLNFVCTTDIIGGNSGSPVINTRQEIVGLVFDRNIELLSGYFIFDDTKGRTVAVHAGGIAAALKYIYQADRILEELKLK